MAPNQIVHERAKPEIKSSNVACQIMLIRLTLNELTRRTVNRWHIEKEKVAGPCSVKLEACISLT